MRFRRKMNKAALVPFTLVASLALSNCVSTGGGPKSTIDQIADKAETGDTSSQYRLGLRYTNGVGVRQNFRTATDWFEKAADGNHASAQFMAGINYYTGRGVTRNYRKAVELYTKSAVQGNAKAQYQLGDAYANGRGVKKDLAFAARYFEQSARLGHGPAMMSFGVIRGVGLGINKDSRDAWLWLSLAAQNKQASADKLRANVEKQLSGADLRALRSALSQWKPEKVTGLDDIPTVRYIQYRLNKLGFNVGPEDGVMGSKTATGISRFAKSKGLGGANAHITQDLLKALKD